MSDALLGPASVHIHRKSRILIARSDDMVTNAIDYLRSVYRNPLQPDNVRMRAAAIAIEYELPRLAVTATVNAGDFAVQLDQAIERSRKVSAQPMMIEAKPMVEGNVSSESNTQRPHVQVSNGGKLFVPDRRFRRW
jgi:hypothetical protein